MNLLDECPIVSAGFPVFVKGVFDNIPYVDRRKAEYDIRTLNTHPVSQTRGVTSRDYGRVPGTAYLELRIPWNYIQRRTRSL